MTVYQTKPFSMAFVFWILVFFIDNNCAGGVGGGGSNKHCLMSFFH